MDFKEILNRKIEYYGKTEAAYEFAAEEYANKLINKAHTEQLTLLCGVNTMEIIRQWIVTTELSENENELALLYQVKNGDYYLSYTVYQLETQLKKISKSDAMALIN